jgi:hypothetical protein
MRREKEGEIKRTDAAEFRSQFPEKFRGKEGGSRGNIKKSVPVIRQ